MENKTALSTVDYDLPSEKVRIGVLCYDSKTGDLFLERDGVYVPFLSEPGDVDTPEQEPTRLVSSLQTDVQGEIITEGADGASEKKSFNIAARSQLRAASADCVRGLEAPYFCDHSKWTWHLDLGNGVIKNKKWKCCE